MTHTAPTNSAARMDLPGDLTYAMDTCARCGFCKTVCTTYPFGGGFEPFSPRAKVHYLKEVLAGRAELSPAWVDRMYQCTTCERCAEVCQTSIPLVHLWEAARSALVTAGLGPMPAHKKIREFVEKWGNPYGESCENQAQWMLPEHKPAQSAELLLFGGCTASYRMPSMLRNGASILQHSDIPYVFAAGKEVCCASPFLRTGQDEVAAKLIRSNLELFAELGVKRIVSPCGGCSKTLKHDYPKWAKKLGLPFDAEVVHFSEMYAGLIAEGRIKPNRTLDMTVTYHDPCHVGRSQGLYDQPRAILAAIPGVTLVEMENVRQSARCCGAGGGVKANYPAMAGEIAKKRVKEAMDTGAETLVTMCPFCQASFDAAIKNIGAPLGLIGVDELLLQAMTP
jgi:Fe-S oxidoreductase